jgi:hypothetical protein
MLSFVVRIVSAFVIIHSNSIIVRSAARWWSAVAGGVECSAVSMYGYVLTYVRTYVRTYLPLRYCSLRIGTRNISSLGFGDLAVHARPSIDYSLLFEVRP